VRYQAYPSYKDSGIKWLGEIPTHWGTHRVRRVARKIQAGSTPPTAEERYYEDGTVPWFGPGSFDERITLSEPVKFLNQSAVAEGVARVFKSGATMVVTIGATVGKVSSLAAIGSCNQQITVIEFNERQVFPRFGTYQLKRLEPALRAVAPSATLPILSQSDIGDLFVGLPTLPEQSAISGFLDAETAKLDMLVTKKQTLIEKLKEQRTALISRTVTRGLPPEAARAANLNPDPNLKPSGIEWLGDIPEHWEIVAVRRVSRTITTGSTPPTAEDRYYEDGTVPWYGPGSFDDQITLSRPVKRLHPSAIEEGTARLFRTGATMVVTIGATLGKVSSLTGPASCNQQITVIEFDENRVYPRFGTYQLKRLEPALRAIAPVRGKNWQSHNFTGCQPDS
jgi:type I restriction enzyme S subunit